MFWFGIDPSRVKLHGSFIVRALRKKYVTYFLRYLFVNFKQDLLSLSVTLMCRVFEEITKKQSTKS